MLVSSELSVMHRVKSCVDSAELAIRVAGSVGNVSPELRIFEFLQQVGDPRPDQLFRRYSLKQLNSLWEVLLLELSPASPG